MTTATEIAITAAKKAGGIILSHFQKIAPIDVTIKSKHEILTTIDLAAEQIIMSEIRAYFPRHSITSEESGRNEEFSSFTWIIDPLDGTTNFAVGNPIFAVSIALFEHDTPILGVVYAPVSNELFVAQKGKGATLNELPIRVSAKKNIEDAYLTFCHGRSNEAIKETVKLFGAFKFEARSYRQLGSAAYESGMLANGRIDGFVMPHSNIWDIAAGVLIIQEAGGKVTDFKGQPWKMNSKDLISTNGILHEKIENVVKKVLKIKSPKPKSAD